MGIIEEPGLLQRHRLTVDEYYRMAEAGVLAPDARVELIEGEIVDMPAMKSLHASAVGKLGRLLHMAVGDRALVWCQLPLRLGERSEPEPDLMLLKPRSDFYADAHPTAGDVLLLIEVADTTSRYDRQIKVPLYARHGVAEVWIVDLDNGLLHFFRQPSGDDYTDITATETSGVTPLPSLPELSVDLSGLLR